MSLLLLAGAAFAAPALTDLGFVLTAPASGLFAGGVNAPTVAWDGTQYVMYFESSATDSAVPDDCATSLWIGRATSPDGLSWTLDEEPVLTPDRATGTSVYACAVGQPAVVFDGTTWHLLFTMGDERQDSSASINFSTGIGYATSTDGTSFTVQRTPTPLGDFDDGDEEWHDPNGGGQTLTLGMPSAVLVNGTLYITYMVSTQLYAARFDTTTGFWELWDPALTSPFLAEAWAGYGVFSPSLYCDPATRSFRMLAGGYTDAGYVTRSAGLASSTDFTSWSGMDGFSDAVFASLNHVEVMPVGGDLLVYYSMTDPSTGLKGIGLAVSATTWGTPSDRRCTWGDEVPDTGDTGGGDTDTDVPTDTDTGADTDTDAGTDTGTDTAVDTDTDTDVGSAVEDTGTGGGGGCGCESAVGDAPGAWAVGVLAAAALRRRRAKARA